LRGDLEIIEAKNVADTLVSARLFNEEKLEISLKLLAIINLLGYLNTKI